MRLLTDNRKIVLILLMVIVVLVAYFLGSVSADYLGSKESESKHARITNSIILDMQSISVGEALTDHTFEDLLGNPIKLSSLLNEISIISFIQPSCPSCIDEMKFISAKVGDSLDSTSIIFISTANPRILSDISKEIGLQCPILYDHRGVYSKKLDISTYPFNVVINNRLIVQDIIIGEINEKHLRNLSSLREN